MKTRSMYRISCWISAALVAASAAAAPHVHGKGRLALAPNPDGVRFELVVAAADVWGFEHEPRTAEEKAQRDAGLAALKGALPGMLQFPADLGCTHDSSNVTAKDLERKADQAEGRAQKDHEHEKEEHQHEHEEERGREHDAGDMEAGGHLEIRAIAGWTCRRSPLGHDVEVRRPPEVPGLSTLEIWVLSASGQSSTVLREPSAAVRLP